MDTRILWSWWSRDRRDSLTTSDPAWEEGDAGPKGRGYVLQRRDGRLLDPALRQPRGTVPLLRWSSTSRKDHATTSHPSWRDPSVIEAPDYRFVRREGWVFDQPYAGTTRLYTVWDPGSTDNATTTHLRWDDHLARPTVRAGGSGAVRPVGTPVGYVLPPDGDVAVEAADVFGYGQFRRNGRRALLVIVIDFADEPVSTPMPYWRDLFAGSDTENVGDYFLEMSAGQLRFDPIHVTRVQITQTRAVAQADRMAYDNAVLTAATTQAGVNLRSYDLDGDGTLTDSDLTVVFITPTGSGGSTRVRTTTIAGTRLELVHICACEEFGDIRLYAHELVHALAFDDHSYGPRARLNARATVYASNTGRTAGDAGPVHLDPWNKTLLGWTKPRVIRIGGPGGSAVLPRAQHASAAFGSGAPLLFYDPARGLDEFFIVEYRDPGAAGIGAVGYDAKVLDRGVAVWYVRRNPPGTAGGVPVLDPALGSGRDGLAVTLDWPMAPSPGDRPTPITTGRPTLSNPRPTGGNMLANFLVGPTGLAVGPLWKPSDEEIILAWPIDRADSGLRLRVGPLDDDASSIAIQWWYASQPFLPRLDRCIPERLAAGQRDHLIVIEGVFPVDGAMQIGLTPFGRGTRKTVGQIDRLDGRIRTVTTRIDAPEELGTYELDVRLPDGSTSNGCLVAVA